MTGDFDFIPMGTLSMAAQEVHIQQLISFLQGTANPVDSQFIDRQYLIEKLYRAFGFRDVERAIKASPPVAPPAVPGQPPVSAPGQPQVSPAPTAAPAQMAAQILQTMQPPGVGQPPQPPPGAAVTG
jgi:hypothetical protein